MLHRSASAPALSPVRRMAERLVALAGASSGLLRYVLIAAVLTAISCLYLWQVNDLSMLHEKTSALRREARTLEQQNVVLAEQLAQWNSPAYVAERSTAENYIVVTKRLIAAPAGAPAGAPTGPAVTVAAASGATR